MSKLLTKAFLRIPFPCFGTKFIPPNGFPLRHRFPVHVTLAFPSVESWLLTLDVSWAFSGFSPLDCLSDPLLV